MDIFNKSTILHLWLTISAITLFTMLLFVYYYLFVFYLYFYNHSILSFLFLIFFFTSFFPFSSLFFYLKCSSGGLETHGLELVDMFNVGRVGYFGAQHTQKFINKYE